MNKKKIYINARKAYVIEKKLRNELDNILDYATFVRVFKRIEKDLSFCDKTGK